MQSEIEIRMLDRRELPRLAEIDRTERIDALVEQHGPELVTTRGTWNAPAWDPDGDGNHSLAAQLRGLTEEVDRGGLPLGAFHAGSLVGIGVVVPHVRPHVAQLAYLHVTASHRSQGVGRRITERLEQIGRDAGDTQIVVSATPSENTVRFYLRRGYRPMAQPFPELFELEPDDIHLAKPL
jgi:GNAT superfamily N-acetyltransferase